MLSANATSAPSSLAQEIADRRKAFRAKIAAQAAALEAKRNPAPVMEALPPAPVEPLVAVPVIPGDRPRERFWFNIEGAERKLIIEDIVREVCHEFKISRARLCGKGQEAEVVGPRQLAMFLSREFVPGASFPRIAKMFGKFDHTTALHAYRAAPVKLTRDQRLRDGCEVVCKNLDIYFELPARVES